MKMKTVYFPSECQEKNTTNINKILIGKASKKVKVKKRKRKTVWH